MNILDTIISPEFLYMWIRVATPILLASLGATVCSKAGVVNLGLEGIMLISALFGVLAGAFFGILIFFLKNQSITIFAPFSVII